MILPRAVLLSKCASGVPIFVRIAFSVQFSGRTCLKALTLRVLFLLDEAVPKDR